MKRGPISILMLVAIVAVASLAAGCGGFPNGSPAKVGDVYLDGPSFEEQVESYASQYGISQETDPDTYNLLAMDVLDSMVNTELAVQKAADLGVEVTDEEIQQQVDDLAATYYEGDRTLLEESLEGQGMTMEELENQIRDYLLVTAVQDAIMADVPQPTDEEIAAYYEENMGDFLTEETIEARHILVGVDGLTVRAFTATTTTESADTSTEESTTNTTIADIEWAQALSTAADLRVQLLNGASWSRLATRYSDDLDTRNDGGNLGVVEAGAFTETLGDEFENTVFYLELNQISEPTQTEYGYELIQVTKINEPQQMTLEEASDDIAAVLLGRAQDEAWQNFIDDAKAEIGVEYASAYQTTTTEAVTTTEEATEETAATAD